MSESEDFGDGTEMSENIYFGGEMKRSEKKKKILAVGWRGTKV